MPRFSYQAVSNSGERLRGEMDAPSREAVIAQLQGSGHLPVSASEITSSRRALADWRSVFQKSGKVSRSDIIAFTRGLATLLSAGLPLDTALQTLENAAGQGAMQALIKSIRRRVQGGASLSEALSEHGREFDRLYLSMVRAGEAGGALAVVIERLADYQERIAELRASIITALIYPAILTVIAVLSLVLLMTFVIPQFIPLFSEAGATLPWLTQLVFIVAEFLHDFWWLLLLLAGAGLWWARKQLADPGAHEKLDGWYLRLPYLGDLIKAVESARLGETLRTLLGNGVPLLAAIRYAADIAGNKLITANLEAAATDLEQGRRVSPRLREAGHLPPLALQLIEVGEESGQLEQMLGRIAGIYEKEVRNSLKRMLTIIEPVLILGLGGIIAVIIMSVLVAILGLNELIA